jgi:hypothetical protein
LLLDECVTRYLKPEFVGHEVSTINDAGFKGLRNGDLLEAASKEFDVLVTVDQNLRYQQNLINLKIAILVFSAARTTFPILKPLVPKALTELTTMKPGDVRIIT